MCSIKQNKLHNWFSPYSCRVCGDQCDETPSAESAGAMEFPEVPSTSASRLYGTAGSGRVLTEAVLQTQRDTINAITVIADELKQIRVVLGDIASTLKDLVKK